MDVLAQERRHSTIVRLRSVRAPGPPCRLRVRATGLATDDLAACLAEEGAAASRPLSGERRVASAPVQLDRLGVVVDNSDLT